MVGIELSGTLPRTLTISKIEKRKKTALLPALEPTREPMKE